MTFKIEFKGSEVYFLNSEFPDHILEFLFSWNKKDYEEFMPIVFSNPELEISGDENDCRKYLEIYGAWDDEELNNHQTNLERLMWILILDLKRDGEAYFARYS